MASFTSLSAGFDWTATSFLNELFLSGKERCEPLIAIPNLTYPISAGTDIQKTTVWSWLQYYLQTVTPYYIDHVSFPGLFADSGLSATRTGWPFDDFAWSPKSPLYTWSRLCTAAGLSASGWRRATAWDPADEDHDWTDVDDAMFSYGTMQTGDIIGPWIFVDLQNVLKKLLYFYLLHGVTTRTYETFKHAHSEAGWESAVWSDGTLIDPLPVGYGVVCSYYSASYRYRTRTLLDATLEVSQPWLDTTFELYFVSPSGGGTPFVDETDASLVDGQGVLAESVSVPSEESGEVACSFSEWGNVAAAPMGGGDPDGGAVGIQYVAVKPTWSYT